MLWRYVLALFIKIKLTIKHKNSAIGIDSQIPFEPINFGRIKSGITIKTRDLPIETTTDSKGFSIAVKKEVTMIFRNETRYEKFYIGILWN